MKTLKVTEYRGKKIYVRHISRETFEYLIPLYGEIFSNLIEINKGRGQSFRDYTEEEYKNAVTMLVRTAQMFIDDKLFQRSLKHNVQNIFHGKSKTSVGSGAPSVLPVGK